MSTTPNSSVCRVRYHRKPPESWFDRLFTRAVITLMNLSHFWMTHMTLVLTLILYTLGGAYLFQFLEANEALRRRNAMRNQRDDMLAEFWQNCQFNNMTQHTWTEDVRNKMIGHYSEVCSPTIWSNINSTPWSLSRSLFFCGTIYTTIGYGNISPVTTSGQMLTIGYALLGIPLLLFVLADIGNFMTTTLRRVYFFIYKCYYKNSTCCQCSRLVRFVRRICYRTPIDTATCSRGSPTGDYEEAEEEYKPASKLFLISGLDEEDFVVPVWVGLLLIIIYMLFGAWCFQRTENWSYQEALYFTFLSLSTIGFGDYLPSHMSYAIILVYFLLGLALVSMFFNMAVEKISITMRKARKRLTRKLTKVVIFSKERIDGKYEEADFPSSLSESSDECPSECVFPVHIFESMPFNYQDDDEVAPPSQQKKPVKSEPVILLQISDSRLLSYVRHSKRRQPGASHKPSLQISEAHMLEYMEERLARSKGQEASPLEESSGILNTNLGSESVSTNSVHAASI